jgi:cytochrome P450
MHVVTRHRDIEYVLRNPQLFSSQGRTPIVTYPGQRYQTTSDLVGTDAPEHRAIRTVHQALLSAKRLREIRPAMEAEANRMVDQFAGRGEVEYISAFAKPFPAWVMGYILCLPLEMHQQVDRWAVEYFELFDKNLHHPGEGGPPPELIKSYVDFMNYCGDLVTDRRENPRDDALSEFVNARRDDGSQFSIDEMANYVRLLVTGGQTTTSLVAQSLVEVLNMKDRGDLADPRHLEKIVDETLRKDGPATFCPRVCTEDVEIGGVALPAGTRVFMAWHSGSRDEEMFECPAEFRPNRPNLARHLGFGQGIHRCIGAPLAKIEAEVGLKTMFSRLRNLRFSRKNDFRHDTSLTAMRVLRELHLEFSAAE